MDDKLQLVALADTGCRQLQHQLRVASLVLPNELKAVCEAPLAVSEQANQKARLPRLQGPANETRGAGRSTCSTAPFLPRHQIRHSGGRNRGYSTKVP